MGNVNFNEEWNNPNFNQFNNSEKGLVGWLVKKGLAKDRKTAQYILLTATAIFFTLAFIFRP
jgi:hypothetical protein